VIDIIHGDIKPDNILIFGTADSYVAKVTDFESSCVSGSDDDLVTVQRTPPWEAPEWHERYFTARDAKLLDVFSFGVLCFWTLYQDNVGERLAQSILSARRCTLINRKNSQDRI
jgi:serine/threonine protein kinase